MEHERDRGRQAGDEAREERIKRLIHAAVTRCSACQRQYMLEDFSVIGHRDHLWMVTVVCEGCRNQGFITAIVEQPDSVPEAIVERERRARPGKRPPRATDLTPADRERFADTTPVSVDDLLDLSVFLDDFGGDFTALFGKKDRDIAPPPA